MSPRAATSADDVQRTLACASYDASARILPHGGRDTNPDAPQLNVPAETAAHKALLGRGSQVSQSRRRAGRGLCPRPNGRAAAASAGGRGAGEGRDAAGRPGGAPLRAKAKPSENFVMCDFAPCCQVSVDMTSSFIVCQTPSNQRKRDAIVRWRERRGKTA